MLLCNADGGVVVDAGRSWVVEQVCTNRATRRPRRLVTRLVALLVVAGVLAPPAPALARRRRPVGPPLVYCTEKGDTPKKIARRYGIRLKDLVRGSGSVQRLLAENRKLKTKNAKRKLRAKRSHGRALKRWRAKPRRKRGKRPQLKYKALKNKVFGLHQAVRIMRPMRLHETRDAVLRVHRGARVAWVAKTYGVPASLVRCVNMLKPRVAGVACKRTRRKGKRRKGVPRYSYRCSGGKNWLDVRLPFPKRKARTTGSPNRGHLRRGELFPRVPGVTVKQKQPGYGATHMITRIIDAVGQVNKRHAETPDLVLGDISRKGGGRLKPHKSHQNGLDADIGYYHVTKVPKNRFTVATAKNLDRSRTWTLVKRLLESGEVQYIFMSTSVQKLLRDYVLKRRRADGAWCLRFLRVLADRRYRMPSKRRKRGASGWERCVLKAFGYRGHRNALIRHAKGHDNHIHVRLFPRGRRARRSGAP